MNYWALECFPAGSALLLPWAALGEAAFALRAQFAPSFSGAVGQQADQPGEDLAGSYLCVAGMTPGLMGCPPAPQSQPLFELRCSNNVVHVHSCADSCALLVNLLQYVMSEGDLHPPPRPPSPTEIAGQKVQVRPGPTGYWNSARPTPRPQPPAPWHWRGGRPSFPSLIYDSSPAWHSSLRALPPCPPAPRWRQPSSTSGTWPTPSWTLSAACGS